MIDDFSIVQFPSQEEEEDNENIITKENNLENITNLLIDFKNNRDELVKMIDEIEETKKTINSLFPTNLDKRYIGLLEQKVKAAFSIYSAILDCRKEISKSLKDEIEMRRKINEDLDETNKDKNIEDLLDIRSIASKINKLKE